MSAERSGTRVRRRRIAFAVLVGAALVLTVGLGARHDDLQQPCPDCPLSESLSIFIRQAWLYILWTLLAIAGLVALVASRWSTPALGIVAVSMLVGPILLFAWQTRPTNDGSNYAEDQAEGKATTGEMLTNAMQHFGIAFDTRDPQYSPCVDHLNRPQPAAQVGYSANSLLEPSTSEVAALAAYLQGERWVVYPHHNDPYGITALRDDYVIWTLHTASGDFRFRLGVRSPCLAAQK